MGSKILYIHDNALNLMQANSPFRKSIREHTALSIMDGGHLSSQMKGLGGGGDWEAKRVTCESREAERANELKCQVRAGARPGFPTHQATSPWEGGGAGEVAAPPFPSPSPLRE